MKIVVGYIRSAEGRAALDAAIAEARLRDAELLVLHSTRGGGRSEERQAVADADERAEVERRLAAEGIRHQVRDLVRGLSPAEDLVDIARREDADLVVIGLRRRSPVGKLVLGSNAQEILLHADCPVLAVKAD